MVERRTRLAPDARRQEILDHARRLFGEKSYDSVSASEVARAAGVTPALVTHYFPGGKRELFLELVAHVADTAMDAIRTDPVEPLRERVEIAIENWLDWLDANRETWLATAGQGDFIADPELQALVDGARDRAVDTLLRDFADLLKDDRPSRFLLRSWLEFNRSCGRAWLRGDSTRAQTALLLVETLLHAVSEIAPALRSLAEKDSREPLPA